MLPGQPADSLHSVPQGENCPASQGKESGETALSGNKARVRHHSVSGEEERRDINRGKRPAGRRGCHGFPSCLSGILRMESV